MSRARSGGAEALWNSGSRIANGNGTNSDYFEAGLLFGGLITGGEGEGEAEAAANFDAARASAFERAGMTDPHDVIFSKVDPKTGTVVEFKGAGRCQGRLGWSARPSPTPPR